jgi:hypothetical protein
VRLPKYSIALVDWILASRAYEIRDEIYSWFCPDNLDFCERRVHLKDMRGRFNDAFEKLSFDDQIFCWKCKIRAGYDIVGYAEFKKLLEELFPVDKEGNMDKRKERILTELYLEMKPHCEVWG